MKRKQICESVIVDIDRLRGTMREEKVSENTLAAELGLSRAMVSSRLNKKSLFNAHEVYKLVEMFGTGILNMPNGV